MPAKKKKPKPKKSLLANGLRSLGEQIDKRDSKNKEREENIQKAIKKKKDEEREKKFLSGMPSFDMIDLED